MTLDELFDDDDFEKELGESVKRIWARSGKKVVRKFRCTAGPKQGRIVASAAACGRAPDPKKRMMLKKTKAAKGKRMVRKSLKTKKRNPASIRVQRLNKQAGK